MKLSGINNGSLQPKLNSGTPMMHLYTTPSLTRSLGCVVTCPTVAFILCLLVFSCLLLHHSFLCHVSSEREVQGGTIENFGKKSGSVLTATVNNMWVCLQLLWVLACSFSMQSELRGLLSVQRTIASHCTVCAQDSRGWTYVLGAQFEHDKQPYMALYGIFIRQRILISCMKGTKWWADVI